MTEVTFELDHEGWIVFRHLEPILQQDVWHPLQREYLNKENWERLKERGSKGFFF